MIPSTFVPLSTLPAAKGRDLYPVRDRLKTAGCRWAPEAKQWFAPPDVIPALEPVLASAPAYVPRPLPSTTGWVPVTGNTYPVRDRLRSEARAVWDKERGAWLVAPDKLGVARGIVATAPARPSHRRTGRYECPDCGEYVHAGTKCWETGLRH